MVRHFSLLVALGIVAGAGVWHGLWTDRWMVSPELEASADRLSRLEARVLGDWEVKEDIELPPKDRAKGGIVGYLGRNYVNRRTGSQVEVVVVSGRPGHIAVHTPEACFPGAGFEMVGVADRVDKAGGSFWCAQFTKDLSPPMRIFWAWNADGHWQAPDNSRLAFPYYYPVLFKLYLIHPLSGKKEPVDEDPSLDLMKLLRPELQRCLFPET